MKALGFSEHGDLGKMRFFDAPTPRPGPGEVLVELRASAFNRLDIWVRDGIPGLELDLPHISGSDGAGVVVGLGEGVTSLAIGQRVALDPGINRFEDAYTLSGQHSLSPGYGSLGEGLQGTHTELIAVPALNALAIPDHVSFDKAAAAGLVYLTAWRMLIDRGTLRAGETVLVIGAGGGVNGASIQIAKLAGATVLATTGGEAKVARARALGADVVVDYRRDPDWSKTIHEHTGRVGVDVVVDNVGAATIRDSIRSVKRGGRIVVVGNTSGPKVEIDLRYIFMKQISLIGSTMGSHDDYRTVMGLVFDGRLEPVIDTVAPFDDGITAMGRLDSDDRFGKVVLSR